MANRKPLPPVARVVSEVLTDTSKVFNVHVDANPAFDIAQTVVIGAFDEAHADNIADALNKGVAWIEVR